MSLRSVLKSNVPALFQHTVSDNDAAAVGKQESS